MAPEIDPVDYANASHTQKYFFIWGLENILRGMGLGEYYFNVPEKDSQYRNIVEHFGAEPTSLEPEIRYKKAL